MKTSYLFTIIALLTFSTCIQAQEETEMKYIFSGDKKIKISGFIGPIMEFSAIGNEFAFFMGGGGGLIFNQKYYVGGYGEGLTTYHKPKVWYGENLEYVNDYDKEKDEDYDDGKISFGHGGFWLGYILHPQKPIHFGISSKIGWGSINSVSKYYKDEDYFDKDENYKDGYYLDHVFVAIPQLEVEFNFTKWFKANVGIGYRVVAGIDKTINDELVYDKKDFNKPEGTITLCFGYFK